MKRGVYWLIFCSFLFGFVAVCYTYTLDFWWSYDDARHLRFALTHRVSDYLFDPTGYRRFSDTYLTPWNILTYNINLSLFGMEPGYFYARHIVSAALLAYATFIMLRLWTNSLWALCGTTFFIISPATSTVVSQLMNTHYLEGLFFTCVAIILFVVSVRRNQLWPAVVGAAFYFLATASKEIFVPLSLALTFLPERSFSARLRYLIPYYAVSAFYLVWRTTYISDSFTGWSNLVKVHDAAMLPWHFPSFLFSSDFSGLIASVLLVLLLLMILWQRTRWLPFALALLVCLFVPLIPVSFETSATRYHVLVTWCLWCVLICSLAHLFESNNRARLLVFPIIAITGISSVLASASKIESHIRQNSNFAAIGKFLLQQSADRTMFLPGYSYSANEVKRLKQVIGKGDSPSIFYDPIEFADQAADLPSLYVLDKSRAKIIDGMPALNQSLDVWRRKVADKKLQVSIRKTESGVEWKFGPYADSAYSVILLDDKFTFTDVAPLGLYRAKLPPMTLIVKYHSAEGWVTYSDRLVWNDHPDQPLSWARE